MTNDLVTRALDRLLGYLPGEAALHYQFFKAHGRLGDFKNPRFFSEMIQARKLYNHNPAFAQLTDQLGAKAYVSSVLGSEWIIPTLWSGESLPPLPERDWAIPFVMKANHGSQWNLFIRSPADLDWPALEASARRWMAADYRPYLKEWFRREIPRKIIIEPFEDHARDPQVDYKFYCFGGKVRYILVGIDRHSTAKGWVMSPDWVDTGIHFNDPRPDRPLEKPAKLEVMIKAAETLAHGFSFVRVDLYDIGGLVRFGEFTFTPYSGLHPIHPPGTDLEFGQLWIDARNQPATANLDAHSLGSDQKAGVFGGRATAI